jgi:prevent-host-death family protein
MKSITFTEFRRQASGLLTQVEAGQRFVIIRHGRPVAEVIPYREPEAGQPSWKRPGLRLQRSGASLADAILAERQEDE